ncbi:hypothetical protein [Pseudoroseomonas cervicalis]|uniref:hypothetical protein n=1 Tax=Teichococcus cervicalis TaxID=204525 RepID=UPI0022F1A73C|nr:hypothetical protein [Pseudoroseomonas cervicalis]WBV44060.1 hypothetical protein PFY06_05700 [Pseudoroseomonas cervicalis]
MRHAGLPDSLLALPRHAPAPCSAARRDAAWDAASWDQVWAEYDAGQAARPAHPASAAVAGRPARRRRGRVALALAAALGCAALGMIAAAPLQAAAQLAALLLRQEVAPLLAQLDHAAPRAPRAAPAAPALGGAADAYLATLSAALREGWQDEAALRQAVAARRQAAPSLGDATLRPVARWEAWQMTGWSSLRLRLAPEAGPRGAAPGLGLDLAWQGAPGASPPSRWRAATARRRAATADTAKGAPGRAPPADRGVAAGLFPAARAGSQKR